jgi:hypothetical protein
MPPRNIIFGCQVANEERVCATGSYVSQLIGCFLFYLADTRESIVFPFWKKYALWLLLTLDCGANLGILKMFGNWAI